MLRKNELKAIQKFIPAKKCHGEYHLVAIENIIRMAVWNASNGTIGNRLVPFVYNSVTIANFSEGGDKHSYAPIAGLFVSSSILMQVCESRVAEAW